MLAHNAAIMGIALDPIELYTTEDRSLLIWVHTLIERVARTREEGAKG